MKNIFLEGFENRFQKVAERWNGKIFGELALISNKPRAATITTITDCHFATLNRSTFELIRGSHERALYKKVNLIRDIPYFDKLTMVALLKF